MWLNGQPSLLDDIILINSILHTDAERSAVQVPNTKYKPPTVIADDDTSAGPFSRHAADLKQRYGAVVAVNLVNSNGSEGKLADTFGRLVARLPASLPFTLVNFDFHKECGKSSYECAPSPRIHWLIPISGIHACGI